MLLVSNGFAGGRIQVYSKKISRLLRRQVPPHPAERQPISPVAVFPSTPCRRSGSLARFPAPLQIYSGPDARTRISASQPKKVVLSNRCVVRRARVGDPASMRCSRAPAARSPEMALIGRTDVILPAGAQAHAGEASPRSLPLAIHAPRPKRRGRPAIPDDGFRSPPIARYYWLEPDSK